MTQLIAKQIKCTIYNGATEIVSTHKIADRVTSRQDKLFSYGFHHTPFGEALVMVTSLGLCALSFVRDGNHEDALHARTSNYKYGLWHENPEITQSYVDRIFYSDAPQSIKLFLKGTPFQVNIWKALMKVNPGHTASYGDIATSIKNPKAVQAAGQAISKNPIAYVVPCHRIIRKSGSLGGYRWGTACKQAILHSEGLDLADLNFKRKTENVCPSPYLQSI